MKITRTWQRSLVAAMLSAGMCASCTTHETRTTATASAPSDGKDRPLMKSGAPMPRKGTPTPIVDPSGK